MKAGKNRLAESAKRSHKDAEPQRMRKVFYLAILRIFAPLHALLISGPVRSAQFQEEMLHVKITRKPCKGKGNIAVARQGRLDRRADVPYIGSRFCRQQMHYLQARKSIGIVFKRIAG
ncbi:MAG: hypothetical protein ACREOO_07760 [bacterium]